MFTTLFSNILLSLAAEQNLYVYFLDVGQGDCIFIKTPNNKTILIDSGPNSAYGTVMDFLKKQKIKTIDLVVATHPHEDHIGNLDSIIAKYQIGKIYMSDITTNTEAFEDLLKEIKKKKLKINIPNVGDNISPDDAIKIIVLSPGRKDKFDDVNDYSIVLKLIYNKNSFLFMGDASTKIEEKLLHDTKLRKYLPSDVLKIGHHGSKYSSSSSFLSYVKPFYAIISAGKKNPYGHPDKSTLLKLENVKAEIIRTDINGTILVTSNGIKVK